MFAIDQTYTSSCAIVVILAVSTVREYDTEMIARALLDCDLEA